MTSRIDFSRDARSYDRRHGSLLPAEAARRLAEAAGLRANDRILEIGAGTGRVAIPLAAAGYRVCAVDPAQPMLDVLRSKSSSAAVELVAAEGGALPFARASFSGVVLARVLYLMADWREALADAARVLERGGSLLHEWGNGLPDEPWVRIREKARELFERAGVKEPFHPGARSEAEVDAVLEQLGFLPTAAVRLEKPGPMALGDFVRKIGEGEYSYTWRVPSEVLHPCVAELEAWARERFDLAQAVAIPREIAWKIHRRSL